MKTLRQISAVTILSLTLAISVLAGQVDTPGVVAGQVETPGVVAGQTDTPGAPAPAQTPTSSATQSTGTAATILITVLSLIYP